MNDARERLDYRLYFSLRFADARDDRAIDDDVGVADDATAERSRRPGARSGSRRDG